MTQDRANRWLDIDPQSLALGKSMITFQPRSASDGPDLTENVYGYVASIEVVH